jgi:hypothetical protein
MSRLEIVLKILEGGRLLLDLRRLKRQPRWGLSGAYRQLAGAEAEIERDLLGLASLLGGEGVGSLLQVEPPREAPDEDAPVRIALRCTWAREGALHTASIMIDVLDQHVRVDSDRAGLDFAAAKLALSLLIRKVQSRSGLHEWGAGDLAKMGEGE